MKKTMLIFAAPLVVMACDDFEDTNSNASSQSSLELVCEGWQNYRVKSVNDQRMVVEYSGTQTLERVESANGEKYRNNNVEIWLNNDTALITEPYGETISCDVVG